MKVPFRQQASEYDCVPTTFINALCYIFDRKDIPPIVIQKVYLYCLDTVSSDSVHGHGTTGMAVQHLGDWFNNFSSKKFPITSEYLRGDQVHLGPNNKIVRCINAGGAALMRVHTRGNCWHYILGFQADTKWIYCYDPYPLTKRSNVSNEVEFIESEGPQMPNLKISRDWLDTQSNVKKYVFGSTGERECLLLGRG